VLTVVGVGYLTGWVRKISLAWIWIGILPAVLLMAGSLSSISSPGVPLFRPEDEVAAFDFLAHNAHKGSVVLASNDTANPLPAHAPLTMIDGHGPESLGLKEILPEVQAFYTGSTPDSQRIKLLSTYHIQYVIWGPGEKALGDWDPTRSNYLKLIYQNATYQVFQVNQAGDP
jgi:hypothetical protein